jgi:predicted Zn-dependent protease
MFKIRPLLKMTVEARCFESDLRKAPRQRTTNILCTTETVTTRSARQKKEMKRNLLIFVTVVTVVLMFNACDTVPISGRKQLRLISERDMIGMSLQAYDEFLDTSQVLPDTHKDVIVVRRIGNKIKDAVVKYLTDNGELKRIDGFEWEFNVVNDPTVNAWCMPGGKVVVYTGILPVTKDEKSLAVVMGHEIAHAVARHGNERMSQGLAVQLGGLALSVALSENAPATQNLFMQSYGIGSNLGMLAYSRNHETEADKLGLVFMAMAGYDPQSSIGFWQRMSEQGGQAPPQILSTHPSDETRIADLQAFMPEAMKYYKP